MWRAATWVARKRRAATRGYVECLGSAARHEWDWRFEYGTEIDVAKVTGHRVRVTPPPQVCGQWVFMRNGTSSGSKGASFNECLIQPVMSV